MWARLPSEKRAYYYNQTGVNQYPLPCFVQGVIDQHPLIFLTSSATTQAVETAAPTGQGLTELEEAILLQAEMMDLKASQTGAAEGTTVEARMTKGQGPVATVIVKRGALKVRMLPSQAKNS